MVEVGLRLAWSIIAIAGLSYLGLGLPPPSANWGTMVSENQVGLVANPWAALAPVIVIAVLTVGLCTFSDAVARSAIGVDRRVLGAADQVRPPADTATLESGLRACLWLPIRMEPSADRRAICASALGARARTSSTKLGLRCRPVKSWAWSANRDRARQPLRLRCSDMPSGERRSRRARCWSTASTSSRSCLASFGEYGARWFRTCRRTRARRSTRRCASILS